MEGRKGARDARKTLKEMKNAVCIGRRLSVAYQINMGMQPVALASRTGSPASDLWSPSDSSSFSFASLPFQALRQEKKESLSDQAVHLLGWTSFVWTDESLFLFMLDALNTYLFPFFFHLSSSNDTLSLSDAPVVACTDVFGS